MKLPLTNQSLKAQTPRDFCNSLIWLLFVSQHSKRQTKNFGEINKLLDIARFLNTAFQKRSFLEEKSIIQQAAFKTKKLVNPPFLLARKTSLLHQYNLYSFKYFSFLGRSLPTQVFPFNSHDQNFQLIPVEYPFLSVYKI